MNEPKVFISYCASQEKLARRLKDDLGGAGCDAWQFNLSATPGSDSWKEILQRIEKSDFFVVLLSPDALVSRPVQEEVSHAHYCSLNNAEGLPRIIPIILADGVVPPSEIVRKVRLAFREENYGSDFELLLRCLDMEPSPFATATELDVTFTRSREFDAQREAGVFASALVRNHPDVSTAFNSLTARARAEAGKWVAPSAQTVIWEEDTYRQRQPQFVRTYHYVVMVVFVLHNGYTGGYESNGRVIADISAFKELKYDYVGKESDLVLHSDTLRLKFEGFRQVTSTPLPIK